MTRLLPTTNEVLATLAEEIEADFATRDTNDGSTFCSHCGAPQPKAPKRKWRHDSSCVVSTIRERIGTWGRATLKGSNVPFTSRLRKRCYPIQRKKGKAT